MKTSGSRLFLLVLFGVALALLSLVVAPFSGAFFTAMVIASALSPWHGKLAKRFGDRPNLAAGLLCTLVLLVVAAPLALTGTAAFRQASTLTAGVVEIVEAEGIDGLLKSVPDEVRPWAKAAVEQLEELVSVTEEPRGTPDGTKKQETSALSKIGAALPIARRAALGLHGFSVGLFRLTLQVVVTVIAAFFLLSQGHLLVDYLVDLAPLPKEKTLGILQRLREVNVAMLSSTLLTAVIQAIFALIGYLIAGLPYLAVLTILTFVCALIPVIGAAAVTIVAALVLIASGDLPFGIFLLLWGVVVVGLIDNVVRPYLAHADAKMPASLLFFAMICGIAVFGPLGIIAGPLIVAFFRVVAETLRGEFEAAT